MHHHDADGHVAAKLYHSDEASHHCFLDEQFCQLQLEKRCDHPSHLTKPGEHCYLCVFHFDQPYELPIQSFNEQAIVLNQWLAFGCQQRLNEPALTPTNKGPPELG